MKKLVILLLCMSFLWTHVHANVDEENETNLLDYGSYCVMSMDDLSILESQGMHNVQSVASISKVMTAILAIEEGDLQEVRPVSDHVLQAHGSMVYLVVGDQISLVDLVYGLMLRSGNDTAVEIAARVSGDVDSFVARMNEKAEEIGMLNTTFANPSGLDDDGAGNMSSAYDMALLMSYAMKNETFQTVTSTQFYLSINGMRWKNKNKLLFDFPFLTGGKTGYTKEAGRTLITSASNDNINLVVVTLNVGGDFEFHRDAFVRNFALYQSTKILDVGSYVFDNLKLNIEEPIFITTKKDGSDEIEIFSHIEENTLYIEVMKNQGLHFYTYPLITMYEKWSKKVFS